ncbi:MAG TPA: tryptophan halogenase family protein [Sphingomicrobium sp.]|jgi:tryptophan halogenase|nr:tryptophan halogenase family protein [Sphingomicrobium sp.]
MDSGPNDDRFRVVILGGGTAGWMTAAALVRRLPRDHYRITLLESDDIGIVGVGEATLPHIKQFNDMLGLDEAEFMRATRATFKVGIEFCDWNRPGDRYIHPFGAFGEPWGGVEFQHHWLRLRRAERETAPFQSYSFAAAVARANVFALPDEDTASIRSTYSYAYHFDSGRYAPFLRDWSTARGAMRIEGKMESVERDPETGAILSLVMHSGERIAGDLFVDCSGFRSLLLGAEMGAGWEDWRRWLPCDGALAVPCDHARDAPLTPYTRSTARKFGWQWRIPLQHRVGNGYIFSSEFASVDDVRETLLDNLDGAPQAEPRLLRFMPGRRNVAWSRNCVAVGLASGFLEPLESTSIFLIQAAIIDLIDLMPSPGCRSIDSRLADEFNRLTTVHYERIRDFLILHYVANQRLGEPLWDYLRSMALPDSLVHKMALFGSRASSPEYRFGLFSRDSWLSVLFGQGLEPRQYDPLADTFDLDLVESKCADFKSRIDGAVAAMPSHGNFIAAYCAASDSVAA